MDKSFTKVLNDRLQLVVEGTVSDSQCGFRAGRDCVDMIFCVCQLVEKTIEHNTKVFLLFIDCIRPMILYPGQPFDVLCRSMVYLQADNMVELTPSLHDSTSATVTVGGRRSEQALIL